MKALRLCHRLVPLTESSVIVAISSPHRNESLEAVHYAIDTLKATVPIWKKVKGCFLFIRFYHSR